MPRLSIVFNCMKGVNDDRLCAECGDLVSEEVATEEAAAQADLLAWRICPDSKKATREEADVQMSREIIVMCISRSGKN